MSHHQRERNKCLELLELPPGSSEEDIKRAYKKQALKYHPDKNDSEDATEKFQQIVAAYNYLLKGESFLQEQTGDLDAYFNKIFRFMFPWLFQDFPFGGYGDSDSDPEYYYEDYDDDDDDDNSYFHEYNQRYSSAQSGRSYHRDYSGPSSRFSFQPQPGASESGASQFHRQNANFSEASHTHGQFFQEISRSGKKRRKEVKRAAKMEADAAREKDKSQEDTRSSRMQSESRSAEGKENASPKSEESSSGSSQKNKPVKGYEYKPSEKTVKKSKKQLQQEQRKREKEMQKIRKEIERTEREKKEKLEQKRRVQEERERIKREEEEERERQERERREAEERKFQELQRKRREEEERMRRERQREEKERREREAKMQKLMAEFDSVDLLDERGQFKSRSSAGVMNIIKRDDLNPFVKNPSQDEKSKNDTINGFNAADLIRLQGSVQHEWNSSVFNQGENSIDEPDDVNLGLQQTPLTNASSIHHHHQQPRPHHFSAPHQPFAPRSAAPLHPQTNYNQPPLLSQPPGPPMSHPPAPRPLFRSRAPQLPRRRPMVFTNSNFASTGPPRPRVPLA